ncbi:putative ATP-dependent RNA helicase [Podosphaera aphanis]|nr:putative ATP-dependent RNA helicase [Podosphaera aphanis]
MRLLGDEYVKSEFRAHQKIENPMHIIGFLTEWQMYAQKLEGDEWIGERMDPAKIEKMSEQCRGVNAKNEPSRQKLPVWSRKKDIRDALRNHDVLLLQGDTGSGKSTQVPQFLYTEPWCQKRTVKVQNGTGQDETVSIGGIIAITQPRRVAAITLAQRVAQEMGASLHRRSYSTADKVGYSVRFDKKTPAGMKIKFVTEGTLLQEMLLDPHLRKYSAVIVDEIHERSVDVDLIVGFLRGILDGDKRGRGGVPLKVVVMSATLDISSIESFFASPVRNEKLKKKDSGNYQFEEIERTREINSDQVRRQSADILSWDGFSDSDDEILTRTNSVGDIWKPTSTSDRNIGYSLSKSSKTHVAEHKHSKACQSQSLITGDSKSNIAMMHVTGRQYEVEIIYETTPCPDYLQRMLQIILQLHVKEPLPGDILAFLTGQEEIDTIQAELENYSQQLVKTLPRMKIVPLYGSLSAQGQQEAFEKVKEKFTRKIVLATNIAETSVTVSGVRYVVDCGKSKVKQYRPRLGLESLLPKPISKVSAIQRAGRAGREAKGKCFRLYTQVDYEKLDPNELPEILRSDVVEAVLKMKARGVNDVLDFPLMDPPDVVAMEKALIRLHLLDALDNQGTLTAHGKIIARLPLPAPYGRVLTAAAEREPSLILEAIDVIACLTTDTDIFLHLKSADDRDDMEDFRTDITHRDGDLLTLLLTMQHYAAEATDRSAWCRKRMISIRAMHMAMQIRKQLRQICRAEKLLLDEPPRDPQPAVPIAPDTITNLLKIFLTGFGTHTAILAPDGGYITTQGKQSIIIHPSSVLYGKKFEAIMYLEHVFTAKSYAKRVSAIEVPWIMEALAL